MSVGRVLDDMSDTNNRSGLGAFHSRSRLVNEYASLEFNIYSNENTRITVRYSGNGKNFDYTETYNAFGGIPAVFNSSVINNWCIVSAQNLSSNPTTTFRFFTFATSLVNVLNATIIGGISIDNFPVNAMLEIVESSIVPLKQYTFSSGPENAADNFLSDVSTAYSDIQFYSSNANVAKTVIYADCPLNGCLSIQGESVFDTDIYASVQGDFQRFRPGETLICRFSASLPILGYNSNNPFQMIGLGYDSSPASNGLMNVEPNDFIGIGFPGTLSTNIIPGIMYYRDSVLIYTPNTGFSVDPLNGQGISGITWDPDSLNYFQIAISSDVGVISFSIMNPNSGKFHIFHNMTNTNDTDKTFFKDNALGLYGYVNYENLNAYNNPFQVGINIGTFMIGVSGNVNYTDTSSYNRIIRGISTSSSNYYTELLLNIRNIANYYSAASRQSIQLTSLNVAMDSSDETTGGIIAIYKNLPKITAGNPPDPAYNYIAVNSTSPPTSISSMQYDVAATIASYLPTSPTDQYFYNYLIYSTTLGVNFSNHSNSIDLSPFYLNVLPGDRITVLFNTLSQTTNFNICTSITWKNLR
jgi:hypothetical protein